VAAAAQATAGRRVIGSRYLGAVLPDSAAVHNIIGTALLRAGRVPDARLEFAEALRREPDSVQTRRNMGAADHEEGSRLLEQGRYAEAADHLKAALQVLPDSAGVHNDLGIALASMGNLTEATAHFRRSVELEPDFEEARRNLDAALRAGR
jgi:Flp pilus assembly protein TadD